MDKKILECIKKIDGEKYTNIYSHDLISYLCDNKNLIEIHTLNETIVRELKFDQIIRIEFYSSNKDELFEILSKIRGEKKIIEILSKINIDSVLVSIIPDNFYLYAKLCRMTNIRVSVPDKIIISNASVAIQYSENYENIRKIFNKYYDQISERIPDKAELTEIIHRKQCVELVNNSGELLGFYVYKHHAGALELRYLFIREEYRTMGYGEILLNDFLRRCPTAKRVILWVFHNNKAAIYLYNKYKFEFDGLINYIHRCKND
jgi:ribosomal protein S18 acetylase RimI-like enzyme